jgi:hypothetical protein
MLCWLGRALHNGVSIEYTEDGLVVKVSITCRARVIRICQACGQAVPIAESQPNIVWCAAPDERIYVKVPARICASSSGRYQRATVLRCRDHGQILELILWRELLLTSRTTISSKLCWSTESEVGAAELEVIVVRVSAC